MSDPSSIHLQRRLGFVSTTSIVVANMIGAGIFTTSGLLLADLGSPVAMLVLWLVGGVVALAGALCYGELAAAIPEAGGEYTFLSRLFHPLLGFLTGWVSFFAGFSAPIAASAIGFAEYLTRAFPGLLVLGPGDTDLSSSVVRKGLAILVILGFTALHMRGLELGAGVQNLLTLLKVLLVVGLVVAGFAFGRGSFDHLGEGTAFHLDLAGLKSGGLALMWIMFAYSGWNAAAYIGSEVRDPGRVLPRSLLVGTALVTLLYLALNLLFVYAAPPAELAGVISVGGVAVGSLFGPTAETVLSVLIAFALFSSLSAFMILGPRVYYAMARDGLFFRAVGRIHPRFGVPSAAVALQGLVAAIMVLLGTFDQILTYMGFALGIFPLLAVAGVFKVRRRGLSHFRMPGYPVAPVFYLVAGAAILALAFLQRPVESSIAIAVVGAGVPFYLLLRRGRGGRRRQER